MSGFLPSGALAIVNEQLARLTAQRTSSLSFGFAGGLVFALWSANAGTKAVMDGLNVAYGETEKRSFIRLTLVAFVFTLGAIFALILALGAVIVAPIVLSHIGIGAGADALIRISRWPVLLALIVLALAVLYRFGPSRRDARFAWITPGAVAASFAWLATSALFSWYIGSFGNYDATYGSLGAAIGMMMWMWISMIVILLGAELNAAITRQTAPASAKPVKAGSI